MNETREETIQRIKGVGTVSGSCFNAIFTYLDFIGKKDSVPEIIERARAYGEQVDPHSVDSLGKYPISEEVALLFATYDVLGWNESDIKELGRNIPRVSLLVKFFLKHFISLEATTGQAKMYWRRHYNFGALEVTSSDLPGGNYIVEVTEFDIHPLYTEFLCGFLETMVAFVSPSPISSEITKYSENGDGVSRFRFFPHINTVA